MHTTQLTDIVVMVSPRHFGFNPETAATNTFQHKGNLLEQTVQEKALAEFNVMAEQLEAAGIKTLILSSRTDTMTPDSLFPNNWFSHHENGTLVLYPMLAQNRRQERQRNALQQLLKTHGIFITETVDLSPDEAQGDFLEGTGSMVLDRENKVAFAMESPRTTKIEFEKWCKRMNYESMLFHAYDAHHFPVYHTNVVMSVGKEFALVCLDSITDLKEKTKLEHVLQKLNKEIIPLSIAQMYKFCGNVLQMVSRDGTPKIIMSTTAQKSFTKEQIQQIQKYGEIISVAIPTIESIGGGSARCMIAEVFK